MKLSQEDIKVLNDCAENKVRIIVSGKNGLGQEFSIEGYLLPNSTFRGRQFGISEYGFDVFVGQTYIDVLGEEVKQSVRFNIYEDAFAGILYDGLYVKNVSTKEGEVIYNNPDFDTMMITSLEVLEKRCPKWSHEPLTDYAKKLIDLIGKPVIYTSDNQKRALVIKAVSMQNGCVCVDASDGYLKMSFPHFENGDIEIDKEAYNTLDQYGTKQLEHEEVLGK